MSDLLDPLSPQLLLGIAAVLAIAVVVLVVLSRVRQRKRQELFATATEAIDALLVVPLRAADADDERARADDVHTATESTREALADLERSSRFETAAAAAELRRRTGELGEFTEQRLRGEGDRYLLDVRITELRERVRGARDRLGAAIAD